MSSEEVSELFSVIPKIANGIMKATNADAFSLAQNNGKAAKQIVPHVHVHIIPRYNSTETLWTKRKILNENELNELAKKIRNCIK
jgi:histidine triad (HIT) family protein